MTTQLNAVPKPGEQTKRKPARLVTVNAASELPASGERIAYSVAQAALETRKAYQAWQEAKRKLDQAIADAIEWRGDYGDDYQYPAD